MRYFAYGMNMAEETMTDFFANYHGIGALVCLGAATLENHKLVFRGVADIVPANGEFVRGRLWDIDDRVLHALDGREGYPRMYGRKLVQVNCGGEDVEALTYYMQPQFADYESLPAPHYLNWLKNGRQEVGLSIDDLQLVMP